jgi:serine/threonine protein kinase
MADAAQPEILSTAERFTEIEEEWGFESSTVVYRLGKAFYVGRSHVRYRSKEEVEFGDLYQSTLIPAAQIHPIFPQHFTRAPDHLLAQHYFKQPRLLLYEPSCPTYLGDLLLEEATVWETLIQSPHPNIVKYHGCQVQDGRITGLGFDKHHDTLMSRVNPGHFGKRHFDASQRPLKDVKSFLEGAEKALKHLHSLGLVHNDINPANIMFASEDDETPIIIDFGSCKPVGRPLQGVGRTPEWYDPSVLTSLPSNDTDALNEIAEWLSLKEDKSYKLEMF